MTFQRISSWLLAVLVCLCISVAAQAQDSSKDRAYELYESGVEAFKNEDYQEATDRFEKAAKIHRNAIVYYNLSLAYWELDRTQDALAAAKTAALMEGELPPSNAARNRARILAMETELGGRDIAAGLATKSVTEVEVKTPVDESDPPPRGLTALGWSGIASTTVGAALLTTTLVLNGRLASTAEDYEQALDAGDSGRAMGLYDELDRQQTTARATFFSGAALVGTGVGMVLWDVLSDQEASNTRVSAGVVGDRAGIDVRIRF